MEIRRIRLTDLEQNKGQVPGLPSNPRQWGRKELDDLVKSIRETPELLEARGLIVWPYEGKYIILGGNMRFSALREMNAADAPCYVLPEDTPMEKLREITIKDNSSFGAWDYDMLANEWDDLPLPDWGVPAWDTAELHEAPAAGAKEVKEKEHIEVRCKRGDIWQLGEHRLMCGDSVSLEDVKRLMGGVLADMTFTSPPYNAQQNLGGNTHMRDSRYLESDDNTSYVELLKGYMRSSLQYSQFSFMNIQMLANNKRDVIDCLSEFKDNYADVMIWDKGNGAPAMAKNVMNACFEFIFIFSREKGASRAITSGEEFRGTIKNVYAGPPQRDNEYSDVHAATFPVHLPAYFIEHFAKETVLDLFGGTGTTMIAAEQLGRKSFLMEIDPRYCDVIIARWEKFTGRAAVKVE